MSFLIWKSLGLKEFGLRYLVFISVLGFGKDRVNFHRNPGSGTARRADPTPTWPNRAGYSIPCAVMLGSGGVELGGVELGGGNSLAAQERGRWSSPGEWLCRLCGLCCVFSLSVSLLFLFPLLAVLLNCPYPDPPVFFLFLSILLCTRRGEGRPCGTFVAGRNQTRTICN